MQIPKSYVYEHLGRKHLNVFYVGAGKRKRAFDLSKSSRSSSWGDKKEESGGVIVRLISGPLTEDEAYKLEPEVIARYRNLGVPLCNKSSGGRYGAKGITFNQSKEWVARSLKWKTGNKSRTGQVGGSHQRAVVSSLFLGKPQKLVECPHCGNTGGNAMKRWHFENCKEKGRVV